MDWEDVVVRRESRRNKFSNSNTTPLLLRSLREYVDTDMGSDSLPMSLSTYLASRPLRINPYHVKQNPEKILPIKIHYSRHRCPPKLR